MAVNCGHVYFLHWSVASKGKLLVPAFVDSTGRVRYFIINTDRTELQEKSAVVCGLHTHTNIRVIPQAANRAKSNRHWPDMP